MLNVTYSWGRTPSVLSQWTSDTHADIQRIANVNSYLHLLCGYVVYYVHIHVVNIRHIRTYLKKNEQDVEVSSLTLSKNLYDYYDT